MGLRLQRILAPSLLSFFSVVAHAQAWTSVQALAPGAEIRVQLSKGAVRGRLDSASDSSLVLTSKSAQQMLARSEIVQVSVKKKSHRGRNALWGLALGAGAGLAVGAGLDAAEDCRQFCILGDNFAKKIFTPMGAILGVTVGALIPTGWETVYRTR